MSLIRCDCCGVYFHDEEIWTNTFIPLNYRYQLCHECKNQNAVPAYIANAYMMEYYDKKIPHIDENAICNYKTIDNGYIQLKEYYKNKNLYQ